MKKNCITLHEQNYKSKKMINLKASIKFEVLKFPTQFGDYHGGAELTKITFHKCA